MKRILGLVVINIVAILIFGILTPNFLSRENLVVIVDNMALEVIVLSGYTLLLISGHFDLSVDGIVALCGVIAGIAMDQGVYWPIASFLSLLLAGSIGAFNGYLVTGLGINAFIATMGTWFCCIGITLGLTKAIAPYGFPEAFQWFGQAKLVGFRIIVIYAIIIAVFLSIILHFTKFGAHIYASGDNEDASEMMGINTGKLGMQIYILLGLLSGFIGLMIASRLNAASPMAVDGMALRVIAASVIGGSNLTGGRGSIVGGLLGLVLMSILSNAAIQLGISPYWQKAVLGGILLLAVLVEQIRRI
jgi:ribose transport system permease protein